MELKSVEELRELAKTREIWGNTDIPPLVEAKGQVLYEDAFENLVNWHHEGRGELTQPEPHLMQLNCVGSRQGRAGCMAFCRTDFPDHICIEYDLKALTTNGLVITFIAARGRNGEDMITDLPPREGIFADYNSNPGLRCYHTSISRYGDSGNHTGVSNWRRNPGMFMMGQQKDLCREPRKWHHVQIVKQGPLLQMAVDGELAGGFMDPDEIPEPIPSEGKVGYRAIGTEVLAQIRHFKVTAL